MEGEVSHGGLSLLLRSNPCDDPGGTLKFKKLILGGLAIAALSVGAAACTSSDADVASRNLSMSAEQFEVQRRIVFFNGITDKYLLVVEGRCSVESTDSALGGSLEVTCKIGPNQFKKHFLGLSDNVSYFVEQTEAVDVNVYHYRVIFKPESIVPYIDSVTSLSGAN